jgi:hypothetical protein
MPNDRRVDDPPHAAPGKPLAPAARRALEEAQARRAAQAQESNERPKERPKELLGRKGPDPVRYGDWEIRGLATDF